MAAFSRLVYCIEKFQNSFKLIKKYKGEKMEKFMKVLKQKVDDETAAFAILVNVILYFSLKKIDMIESLKSVE